MENQRQSFKFKSPARLLMAAIILALGAQGCAQKTQPSASIAPREAGKPVEPAAAKQAEPVPPPPAVIEQQALDRLKAMSDKLVSAKSFTFHGRSTVEVPAKTGQFLTRFIESEVALQRPNKLSANVTGDVESFKLYFDGNEVSALDPDKNLYASAKAPASIDEMLPFVMEKAGIDFPSADLLTSNPYAEMTKGLTHAIVVGPSKVNGIPTEHFAFMGPESNWEVWIETGENALPRRVAVTYKTVPNFPRFQVEYLDWNLKPKLSASQFVFTKPSGAKPIEFKPVGQAQ